MGTRIYVGNLSTRVTESDLEDEFKKFGSVRNIWVARQPPGFAFVVMEDDRDAEDAIHKLDGLHGWKVEFSRQGNQRRPPHRNDRDNIQRCYDCGEPGHLARECRMRRHRMGSRYDRSSSREWRRSRSRSYDRRRERSFSRGRSFSPGRDRSFSRGRSPGYRDRQGDGPSQEIRSRERSRSISRGSFDRREGERRTPSPRG